MTFYIYENWQAGPHKARIHNATCRFCNNGNGIHPEASEENGKWHGPFKTLEETLTKAEQTGGKVSKCHHCFK
ncbi:MAG: hypothetical protein FP831_18155 [Anaerolineae bacterium]|nr:hypothetical protein [Anaerolineae bacterium]